MASLSYLTGGEQATAARLNLIFAELDRKLSLALQGRSPIVASNAALPVQLLGKVFTFTAGVTPYSRLLPGIIDDGGTDFSSGLPVLLASMVRAYDHSVFTTAAASATITSTDDGLRIAKCSLAGLATNPHWLFDDSLSVHKRDISGKSYFLCDSRPYYFRNDSQTQPNGAEPERYHDWALAEIVLEGITQLNIPDSWDKYRLFRLHNLNYIPATVTFAGTAYSVTLPPFGCATVRRDRYVTDAAVTFSNYRAGLTYFFLTEGGDPRFFRCLPTLRGFEMGNVVEFLGYPDASRPGIPINNSLIASNLTNPAILFDWVNWLAGDRTNLHAWIERDPTILSDCYPSNVADFADPSSATSLLGDLLHHKGDLITASTVAGATAFGRASFTGYASIAEDMAKSGITVAESGGNLALSTAAAGTLDLIPQGTNLTKSAETIPQISLDIKTSPVTIESAVLDQQTVPVVLAATAPQIVFPRDKTTTQETRSYYADDSTPSSTARGSSTHLAKPQATARPVLDGIHRLRVSDILDLHFWGDAARQNQSTPYQQFLSPKLTLTPEGLVMTYTERIRADQPYAFPFSVASDDDFTLSSGKPRWTIEQDPDGSFWWSCPKAIKWRGHGWALPDIGYIGAAFYLPRYGPAVVAGYIGELAAAGGSDFALQPLGAAPAGPELLERPGTSNLRKIGKFWKSYGDAKTWAVNNQNSATFSGDRVPIQANRPDHWYGLLAMPLAVEHYNLMAGWVNSIVRYQSLSYRFLRGYGADAASTLTSLQSDYDCAGQGDGSSQDPGWGNRPAPIECFRLVISGSNFSGWMTKIGIALNSEADLDSSYASAKTAWQVSQTFEFTVTARLTNPYRTDQRWFADITTTMGGIAEKSRQNVIQGSAALPGEPNRDVTQAAGNGVSINLATSYSSARWLAITTVSNWIRNLGLKFHFSETAIPLALETLNKASIPSIPEQNPVATVQAAMVLDDNPWGYSDATIVEKLLQAVATPQKNSVLRTIQQTVFRRTDVPSEAKWKLHRFDLSKKTSAGPRTIQTRRNRSARVPEWFVAIGFSTATRDSATSGGFLGFLSFVDWHPATASNTQSYSVIEFSDASPQELLDYDKWVNWWQNETQSLLVRIESDYILPTAQAVLVPLSQWGQTPDWQATGDVGRWCRCLQSLWNFDSEPNGGNFGRAPYSLSPPAGTVTRQTLLSGINILTAGSSPARYSVIVDAEPPALQF